MRATAGSTFNLLPWGRIKALQNRLNYIFFGLLRLHQWTKHFTIMKTMFNNDSDLAIESGHIKEGALVYRAINHPLRQTMMRHLHQNGRMTVTQIYNLMQLEQSVTSQHLAILRNKDLLVTERAGKFVFYSINYGKLDFVHQVTKVLINKNEKQECFDAALLQ